MKTISTLTTLALLGGTFSVLAQGTIRIADGLNSGGSFGIQIFQPQPGGSQSVTYGGFTATGIIRGNSGDVPFGNSSYNTSPGSAMYAAGSALGHGYSMQLLGAPGANNPLPALVPEGIPVTSWYTDATSPPNVGSQTTGFAGYWQSQQVVNIIGTQPGDIATVAIASWFNNGGAYATLAQAQAAGATWGISETANTAPLGGPFRTPPLLPTSLSTFSLGVVPEPCTIALGVLGACSLLFRSRK